MGEFTRGKITFIKCEWALVLQVFFSLLLTACADEVTVYAPVSEISAPEPLPKSNYYKVRRGETLYEIAWRYGLDYRDVASFNHINPPYAIYPAQLIYLSRTAESPIKKSDETITFKGHWMLPAEGPIVSQFSATHRGVNISGHLGDPIVAARAGTVVYSGSGLRGYGNLIILKHDALYLSAYAHNRLNLVKEGDEVMQGQKIAEMGEMGTHQALLHFELRRAGQPINPVKEWN